MRIVCFGLLDFRLVVVGYTERGAVRHILSLVKPSACACRQSPSPSGGPLVLAGKRAWLSAWKTRPFRPRSQSSPGQGLSASEHRGRWSQFANLNP